MFRLGEIACAVALGGLASCGALPSQVAHRPGREVRIIGTTAEAPEPVPPVTEPVRWAADWTPHALDLGPCSANGLGTCAGGTLIACVDSRVQALDCTLAYEPATTRWATCGAPADEVTCGFE